MSGKAIISNKIYLSDKSDDSMSWANTLKEELTHKIPVPFNPNGGRFAKPYKIIKSYSYIGKGVFAIPSGREDLIPSYFDIVDKRIDLKIDSFPEFQLSDSLRDSQIEAISFAQSGNCLISARPGWGKTFTALAIASHYKQRTLILTHTVALATQWIDEICKVYGMKREDVGTIWEGTCNLGKYITVGIIKTAYNNKMILSKEFGLVIVDEVHHLPADQFSGFVDFSHAKIKIGMSGTLERKDKKHCLIYDYISNRVYNAPDENVMHASVDVIKLPIDFDAPGGVYANKVTSLNLDPLYTHMAASTCKAYAEMGHSVLFVADRIAGLEAIASKLGDDAVLYHSSLSPSEKAIAFSKMRSGKAKILVGSVKIFMEGISENYLSCLVLGCSVTGPNLKQLVGRVIREREGKIAPKIVELLPTGRTMQKHHTERLQDYADMEYTIEFIE